MRYLSRALRLAQRADPPAVEHGPLRLRAAQQLAVARRLQPPNLDLFAGSDTLQLFSGFFNGSFGDLGHCQSYCKVSYAFYCSMQLLRASRQSLHYALRLGWAHNQTSWYWGAVQN